MMQLFAKKKNWTELAACSRRNRIIRSVDQLDCVHLMPAASQHWRMDTRSSGIKPRVARKRKDKQVYYALRIGSLSLSMWSYDGQTWSLWHIIS